MEYLPIFILLIGVGFIFAGLFFKSGESPSIFPQRKNVFFSPTSLSSSSNSTLDSNSTNNENEQLKVSLEKIQQKLDKMGIEVNSKPSSNTTELNDQLETSVDGSPTVSVANQAVASSNSTEATNPYETSPSINFANRPIEFSAIQDNATSNNSPLNPLADLPPQDVVPSPQNSSSHQEDNITTNQQPSIEKTIYVAHENPKLFRKQSHLYFDSSNRNSYTGIEADFEVDDVLGIRRFGDGTMSYDGYNFFFEHQTGVEKFALELLDHIAFYPNCVVLVPKNDLPSALFFIDESNSLRQLLTNFQSSNSPTLSL